MSVESPVPTTEYNDLAREIALLRQDMSQVRELLTELRQNARELGNDHEARLRVLEKSSTEMQTRQVLWSGGTFSITMLADILSKVFIR